MTKRTAGADTETGLIGQDCYRRLSTVSSYSAQASSALKKCNPVEERSFKRDEKRMADSFGWAAAVVADRRCDGTVKLAICESEVEDYPGLWLRGTSSRSLSGVFPPDLLKGKLERDRDIRVTQAADYMAVTRGTRTFPWRLIAIAEPINGSRSSRAMLNQPSYASGF